MEREVRLYLALHVVNRLCSQETSQKSYVVKILRFHSTMLPLYYSDVFFENKNHVEHFNYLPEYKETFVLCTTDFRQRTNSVLLLNVISLCISILIILPFSIGPRFVKH